jgi:predicted phosphodiesterase
MSESNRIRIVCTSDTHNEDPSEHVPDGDVFIHAGDMTNHGTFEELEKAYQWIKNLPHKLKIVISGTSSHLLHVHVSN